MKIYRIFFLLFFIIGCSNADLIKTEIETLLITFGETWTSHDIDTMISLFTDDCIYEEVVSGDIYEGKEGVATYAKETFLEIPDFSLEVLSINFTDKWAMMEWIMKGSYSVDESISGAPDSIKTFAIKGASMIELKDGKIFKVRDYWASK